MYDLIEQLREMREWFISNGYPERAQAVREAAGIIATSMHIHVNAHDGTDRCAVCGDDLRSPIHRIVGFPRLASPRPPPAADPALNTENQT